MLRFILFLLLILPLHAKIIDAVAVVIADDIITTYDIEQEMKLSHTTKKEALDILIRKKLEEAEIKKRGIEVSDEEVYDEIRRIAAANRMSISQFYDTVRETNGLTSKELKAQIKQRLLSQKLYQDITLRKMSEPDETEIKNYYKLHKNDFSNPLFFDVIIYKSNNKALLEKKITNPMFFSMLISQEEQRLPYDRINPQLAQLLKNTKQNHFTRIIPQRGGYMTFYIKRVAKGDEIPFDKVKNKIINILMAKKRAEILDDYFAKLKDATDIKIIGYTKQN